MFVAYGLPISNASSQSPLRATVRFGRGRQIRLFQTRSYSKTKHKTHQSIDTLQNTRESGTCRGHVYGCTRRTHTRCRVLDVTILSRATRVLSGGAKGLDGGNSIYVPPAAGGTVGAIQTLRPIAFPRPPPVPSPVPRSLSPRPVARGESGKGVGIRRGGTRGSLCAVGA